MMPSTLQDRFEQLLGFAKNPVFCFTARENLARARELIDTLHLTGHLTGIEYNACHSLITNVVTIVSIAEMKRAAYLPDVHDCANGRMHDAPETVITTMPGGYIA